MWMAVIMVVLWLFVAGVVGRSIRASRRDPMAGAAQARANLDELLNRGEIDRDEYRSRRHALSRSVRLGHARP